MAIRSPLATENVANNLSRWQMAYGELKQTVASRGSVDARDFNINLLCILDTSGSMAGKRLNALKLGLCCLVAELQSNDRVSLVSFNSRVNDLSGGFISPDLLGPMLPGVLTGMKAQDSTAFYDAILASLDMMAHAPASVSGLPTRNIVLALTDGEDTCSTRDLPNVIVRLRIPDLENFMFMTVTVDLEEHVLRTLAPAFYYAHCKRIDVTVRTGRRLIGVFGETVILRILRDTDEGDFSFFSRERGMVLREGVHEGVPPNDAPPPYSAQSVHQGVPRRLTNDDDDTDYTDSDEELGVARSPTYSAGYGAHSVRSSSPMNMRCASDCDSDSD